MADHAGEVQTLTDRFIDWCADTSPAARLQRTIVQGVVGVVIGLLTSWAGAPEWLTIVVIPVVMAILAPIQAEIGKSGQ